MSEDSGLFNNENLIASLLVVDGHMVARKKKLEFVLLPAGTDNSGRLNINCKAITLEIYSYLFYRIMLQIY